MLDASRFLETWLARFLAAATAEVWWFAPAASLRAIWALIDETVILRDRPSKYDSSSSEFSSSYNRVFPQSSMCFARRGLTTKRSSSLRPVEGMLTFCLASRIVTDAGEYGRFER